MQVGDIADGPVSQDYCSVFPPFKLRQRNYALSVIFARPPPCSPAGPCAIYARRGIMTATRRSRSDPLAGPPRHTTRTVCASRARNRPVRERRSHLRPHMVMDRSLSGGWGQLLFAQRGCYGDDVEQNGMAVRVYGGHVDCRVSDKRRIKGTRQCRGGEKCIAKTYETHIRAHTGHPLSEEAPVQDETASTPCRTRSPCLRANEGTPRTTGASQI